jgi:hypothetical protein
MKRGLIILIVGLIAGAAAYGCVYFLCMSPARKLQQSDRPELAWLKEEFKLPDAEFQRVCELHRAYLPQCAEMCRRVGAQNEKLQSLLRSETNVTPEIERTLAEIGRLRAECQAKMLRHFFEVSRTMPPEEGRRYLGWVQEKAFASDLDMASTHKEALHDSLHQHISEHH